MRIQIPGGPGGTFDRERDELYESLRRLRGESTDGRADVLLLRQAHDTVRARWGEERYLAGLDERFRGKARLSRRLANGGDNGRYSKDLEVKGSPWVNGNGKTSASLVGTSGRGDRRRARAQRRVSPTAPTS